MLFKQALSFTQEHFWRQQRAFREFIYSSKFNQSITSVCDAVWTEEPSFYGQGCVIIQGRYTILMAGSASSTAETSTQAEIQAIRFTMKQLRAQSWDVKTIYTDCLHAIQIIRSGTIDSTRRSQEDINYMKQFLEHNSEVELKFCPREINHLADTLSHHARGNLGLSLYHRGSDKPSWLEEKLAARSGALILTLTICLSYLCIFLSFF